MRNTYFVAVGGLLGLLAGVVVGASSGPWGATWGGLFGMLVGLGAGWVMDREEKKRAERTRSLDDTIGVTRGSLGVPPSSLRPTAKRTILEDFGAEWLTPPPPAFR